MANFQFSVNRVDVHNQKASTGHSDSDWLTIVCTVIDPITKNAQVLPSKMYQIGSIIHTGDVLTGPFRSGVINAKDTDVVTVNFLITNLGSSDNEAQFSQAVKVTAKVVETVATVVETIFSAIGGDPAAGLAAGSKITSAINTVLSTLSDIFDFLGIHFAAPNCNGEILHDTLTFQPDGLKQAVGQVAGIEYPNANSPSPPQADRCGAAPHTRVTFSVVDPSSVRQFMLIKGLDPRAGLRQLIPPSPPLPASSLGGSLTALMG